jgi:hypothetical protein|nr:MAG TPA_asm: hypothetical protein [Bacteriophage sp.]
MKELTKEQISKIVDKAFSESVENIIDIFTDNIESFSDTLKDESTGIKNSALYFASMTTVLQISKQTLKETIYEILLEEE